MFYRNYERFMKWGIEMRLYHGSNVAVSTPEILPTVRALDFGPAFYLTSSIEQAKKWAKLKSFRLRTGVPTVTVFEFNEKCFNHLRIKQFDAANSEWLKYVSVNRKGNPENLDYDIVIGPVANDDTMPVINLYLKGSYNEEEAVRRLLPQNLKDQYAFKTEKALQFLTLCEVIDYE